MRRSPIPPTSHRYAAWDGSQAAGVAANDALRAMVDDLMEHGDLRWAMRSLLSRGLTTPDGKFAPGLREMLRKLRERKRNQLDRFDLSTIFKDLEDKLDEILALESATIDDWLAKAEQGAESAGENAAKDASADAPNDGTPAPSKAGEGAFTDQVIAGIAERNRAELDALPDTAAGKMEQLERYEFLNHEAQRKFIDLLNQLRQAMTQTFFKDIEKMVRDLSAGDLERMKAMLARLNELLSKKAQGVDPDVLHAHFKRFMDEFGDMFGSNPPQTLDELLAMMRQQMAAAQALFNSLSPDQRQALQALMRDRLGDPELGAEMQRLAEALASGQPRAGRYRFGGTEDIDLQAALQLMGEMRDIDELIGQIQAADRSGDLDPIDRDLLQALLGDEDADGLDDLKALAKALAEAGYIRPGGDKWELTPRGARMIGECALGEIYARLRHQNLGSHAVPEEGRFGERLEQTKAYEFGDPFHLHMPRTIRNAIDRDGPKTPVALRHEDFEIYRAERLTSTATAMLVDLSWSMALRGAFQAAKKVALALHNLVTSQFPKDTFHVIGFAAYAKELPAHELPFLQWDEYVLGTNMQHALLLAERLLAKHATGTKQIIMISDGEPTAHLEGGRARFAYPPTAQTYGATLRAVKKCTQRGVAINTFMLDADRHLKAFVDAIARINGGRVFFTSPEQLGQYILVDYVRGKRRRMGR